MPRQYWNNALTNDCFNSGGCGSRVKMPDLYDTNNPIQILLIEDREGDAVLIRHAAAEFASPVTITTVLDAAEALVLVVNPLYQPDLIILELNTPKVDGHTFLRDGDQRRKLPQWCLHHRATREIRKPCCNRVRGTMSSNLWISMPTRKPFRS